jgi:hypothetical protein
MEYWNTGRLVFKRILAIFNFIIHTNFIIHPILHYSSIPAFQLSLPARAPGRLALLGWRASLQWQAGRSL